MSFTTDLNNIMNRCKVSAPGEEASPACIHFPLSGVLTLSASRTLPNVPLYELIPYIEILLHALELFSGPNQVDHEC